MVRDGHPRRLSTGYSFPGEVEESARSDGIEPPNLLIHGQARFLHQNATYNPPAPQMDLRAA